MKKLLLVLVACLFVSGCGNKVVCSITKEEDGNKSTGEITATIENDIVSKATTKYTSEFKDEKTAKSYCKLLKGTKGVKCDGKKVIMEETTENTKNEKITKKEFIKEMEDEGFKCK